MTITLLMAGMSVLISFARVVCLVYKCISSIFGSFEMFLLTLTVNNFISKRVD